MLCSYVLAAVIYITTHCSVFFCYLIFIILLTYLLNTMYSAQPLSFPTENLHHKVILVQLHTRQSSCSTALLESHKMGQTAKHHFILDSILHWLSAELSRHSWEDREHIQNISRASSVPVHCQQRDKFSLNTNYIAKII